MKRLDNNAFTLVFEAIIFAVLIALSLFIFYQLSPSSPTVSSESFTKELKTVGDDTLRYIYNKPVNGILNNSYPDNTLAYYFITNNSTALKNEISYLLPNTVEYNLYFSNGIETIFWFSSGDEKLEPLGATARCHRSIPADYDLIQDNWTDDPIPSYRGSVYDIILELWYV
ncbi:MAG: hypothetical protein J7K13_06190 [Thermoplasmata archaeon]|nr:hypothetical protein [Thermoplasmata archaeon]